MARVLTASYSATAFRAFEIAKVKSPRCGLFFFLIHRTEQAVGRNCDDRVPQGSNYLLVWLMPTSIVPFVVMPVALLSAPPLAHAASIIASKAVTTIPNICFTTALLKTVRQVWQKIRPLGSVPGSLSIEKSRRRLFESPPASVGAV